MSTFLIRTVTLAWNDAGAGSFHWIEADGTRLPLNRTGYSNPSNAFKALSRFYAVSDRGTDAAGFMMLSLTGMAHPNREIAPRDQAFVGRMIDHDIAQEAKAREAARSAAPAIVAQPVQQAQADASALLSLADAVAPVVARLMAMPVQQAQGRDMRAATPILQRLAEALATLADVEAGAARPDANGSDRFASGANWNRAFDECERLKAMAVAADAVAYVRAYPSHAFAYRHLLPADMAARVDAAETDAAMIEAIR